LVGVVDGGSKKPTSPNLELERAKSKHTDSVDIATTDLVARSLISISEVDNLPLAIRISASSPRSGDSRISRRCGY
jgi:hypothetical protein